MLEGITWLYPLLLTVVVVIAVFLSTRSSDWYERSRKAIQSGFLDIGGAFNNLAPSRKCDATRVPRCLNFHFIS